MKRLYMQLFVHSLSHSLSYEIKHFVCVQRKQKVLRHSQSISKRIVCQSSPLQMCLLLHSHWISSTHFSFSQAWVRESSCKLQIIHRFNENVFIKRYTQFHIRSITFVVTKQYTKVRLLIQVYVSMCIIGLFLNLNKT